MKSLRQAIKKSWFPEMTLIQGNLATALQLSKTLSLTELVRHLDQPEVRTFKKPLDADALHGEAELILRSDGTYTFRGHVRATGFPSFAYRVQASLRSAGGLLLVMESSGRVFGTDTPGDRQKEWNEDNHSDFIRQFWMDLRSHGQLETNLGKDLSGVLGGLVDVGKTVLETYVAAQFAGAVGAVIVLGSELGSATGQTFINPNILAGLTVAGGILVVFGPSAIIPALAAGTGTALLADIRYRSMNNEEIILARKVFKDKLPIDRIRITDLYRPGENGIAREFVIPGIDGSILVNMGKNFDHTLEPDVQRRASYSKPGEVLIHELTHAWQIHYTSFLPGLLCDALINRSYEYDAVKVSERASWSSSFGLEEQATIVDRWFGDNASDLDGPKALNDPRFFYISQHIRFGQA
jgi:hypothetical protein